MFSWKKLKLPKEWVESWTDYLQYTPDALNLERRMFHRVFIPDEMMSNNKDHHHIGANSAKINLGFITQDKFSYLKKVEDNHITGIPLREPVYRVPQAQIRGELYAIRPNWLIELDNYKENGVKYHRERVTLRIPYHIQKKDWDKDVQHAELKIPAWMYIGNPVYWHYQLENSTKIKSNDSVSYVSESAVFSPVKTFIPHNPLLEEYYHFTPLEYDTLKFKLDTSTSTVSNVRKFRRSS